MMDAFIPAIIAVSFTLLLAALIVALIFSRDFRDAVLGGPGEARILNLLTVKGVAIVLLSGLLIAGLLFALEKMPRTLQPATPTGPITMRLNVHFVPDEVNPRNPRFNAKAYLKTDRGIKPIPIVHKVSEGALSVQVNVPDMETPFFIVFETPRGTWKTDDHSVQETVVTARASRSWSDGAMLRIWWKLAITLGTTAVLFWVTVPSHAALAVKNTSTYVGAGRWDWTIFVDADPDTLRQIECVEYVLHATFPDPVRRVCNRPNMKFGHSANGWGTFTVKVNILYRDGRVEALEHALVFKQEPTPVPLNVIPKNWSKQMEPGWWEWGVYVEAANKELDRIRCVEYTLHPTFPNPVRVVCNRARRFELIARGWGTFTVGIKLMLKDGSVYQLSHTLEFR